MTVARLTELLSGSGDPRSAARDASIVWRVVVDKRLRRQVAQAELISISRIRQREARAMHRLARHFPDTWTEADMLTCPEALLEALRAWKHRTRSGLTIADSPRSD